MKQLFFALSIGAVLLCAFAAAATGAGVMIYDVVTHGNQFMKGFELFGIGGILFVVTISAYILCQVQEKQNIFAQSLADFMQFSMDNEEENHNHWETNHQQFDSEEEFIEHRDQVIANTMGLKVENAKRKLELMSVSELKQEKIKAVADQNFEYAGAIHDVIERKKKSEKS